MVSFGANPEVLSDAGADRQYSQIEGLSRALARRGDEVEVHARSSNSLQPDRVTLAPGVTWLDVVADRQPASAHEDTLSILPTFTSGLVRQWSRRPPDVVHAHHWTSGLAASHAASLVGIPLVVTFHTLSSATWPHPREAAGSAPGRCDTERALARHADAVLAASPTEMVHLGRLGAPPERIALVPQGVDIERFSPRGPQVPRGSMPYRLVVVGRLVPQTGVDDAIRTLPRLPDCELVVAGRPDRAVLPRDLEVGRLRRLAGALGVADRVRFLGEVPEDGIPALIRSADVVMCLSWGFEAPDDVALEAMACGRPVVATQAGGPPGGGLEGWPGVLVPPRSPDAVASAVIRLLYSPGLRREMGESGRWHVEQTYAWDRVAAQTQRVYRELVESASVKPRTHLLAAADLVWVGESIQDG